MIVRREQATQVRLEFVYLRESEAVSKALDGFHREKMLGSKRERTNFEFRTVVMEIQQIRARIGAQTFHHCPKSPVRDFQAERFGRCLQFEVFGAGGANEVADAAIVRLPRKCGEAAAWAR